MKIRTDFVTNSSSSSFVAMVVSKDKLPCRSDEYCERLFERVLEENRKYYSKYPEAEKEMTNMNPAERRAYIVDNYEDGDLFINPNLTLGGIERDYIGVTIETILNKYPDWKISEIKSEVAKLINEEFGTNFTKNNIFYVEEAWMDY